MLQAVLISAICKSCALSLAVLTLKSMLGVWLHSVARERTVFLMFWTTQKRVACCTWLHCLQQHQFPDQVCWSFHSWSLSKGVIWSFSLVSYLVQGFLWNSGSLFPHYSCFDLVCATLCCVCSCCGAAQCGKMSTIIGDLQVLLHVCS